MSHAEARRDGNTPLQIWRKAITFEFNLKGHGRRAIAAFPRTILLGASWTVNAEPHGRDRADFGVAAEQVTLPKLGRRQWRQRLSPRRHHAASGDRAALQCDRVRPPRRSDRGDPLKGHEHAGTRRLRHEWRRGRESQPVRPKTPNRNQPPQPRRGAKL
jgi:hypothetical protein